MTATPAPDGAPVPRLPDENTMSRVRRIVVFRALQLGDLLVAVPALRSLRARFPRAQVTLVSLPWARAIMERYAAYVDDLLEFPGWPGLPERPFEPRAVPAFLAAAQAREFDLAVQLHGSGSHVNELVALLGARRVAGFFRPGDHVPDPPLFVPWPEAGREVDRLLALVAHLGGDVSRGEPEFPLLDRDASELAQVAPAGLLARGYACIHPGARFPSRRWPAERFAAVADTLAERGLAIVITGTEEERDVTSAVTRLMRREGHDLTGALSLGALAALLSRARVVVSNDTGVSHVAAGVRAPSVVIASGSDAERWRPGPGARHRLLWHGVPCRPCGHRDCPIGHPCALGVGVEEVTRAALALLAVRHA